MTELKWSHWRVGRSNLASLVRLPATVSANSRRWTVAPSPEQTDLATKIQIEVRNHEFEAMSAPGKPPSPSKSRTFAPANANRREEPMPPGSGGGIDPARIGAKGPSIVLLTFTQERCESGRRRLDRFAQLSRLAASNRLLVTARSTQERASPVESLSRRTGSMESRLSMPLSALAYGQAALSGEVSHRVMQPWNGISEMHHAAIHLN
jgi:hypothetical protein